MFKTEIREFKVGDTIVVTNWLGINRYKVTRVTKTQAICEIKRNDGTEFTAKYKKFYKVFFDESGEKIVNTEVNPIPFIEWNTNRYQVLPNNFE